jgi:carboxyl-terminal processing protease
MLEKIKSFPKAFIAVLILIIGTSAATVDTDKYFEMAKNIEIYATVYRELNAHFVEDIDPGKLMRTGIDAMMNSLDPFTNYISENEMEGYRILSEGSYKGIGADLDKVGEYVAVIEILEGGPAQKSGIKAGDIIWAVDGKSAKNKSVEEIGLALRGTPNSEIALTIKRPGENKEQIFKLKREEVTVSSVPYYGLVDNEIGYIVLTAFAQDASTKVREAYVALKKENPNLKGLVFDLRENGGGLLGEAVNICGFFVPKDELIVTTRGRVKERDQSFKTETTPIDLEMPIAFLINKHSASASEIVTGALQDLDRAVLLGQRSYGKGLVQNMREVGYNGKIKLTTSKYFIPSGRCIQGVRYEKGKAVGIPDSLRVAFKTRSGRKVLDGGGITPDILLSADTSISVLKALEKQHLLFEYINNFVSKNPTIPPAKEFTYKDYDGFVSFLESKNFSFETELDKAVNALKNKAISEGIQDGMITELKYLQDRISKEKKSALEKYRSTISRTIEKEIAARYYYQRGKSEVNLKNDPEVKAAISLLKDKSRYKSTLEKK